MEILYTRNNQQEPDSPDEATSLKTNRNNDLEMTAILLREKLISAVKDDNEDIVKSLLDKYFNTSYIFEKSRSSDSHFENQENKLAIWKDAMYIAMEKDTKKSEEILNRLLDFDILSWLEVTIGCPILHRLSEPKEAVDDKYLRLIEVLLKSGQINVNATDVDGKTALHLVEEEKIVPLLIRHGADVNRKDGNGKTPLMRLTVMPVLGIKISVLQTIFIEAGTVVDHYALNVQKVLVILANDNQDGEGETPLMPKLRIGTLVQGPIWTKKRTVVDPDAMDGDGRTVLMYGAMDNRPGVVETLLYVGASVNLSDHLGFTALHHALYMPIFGKTLHEYDEFPRNPEELNKRKEIFSSFCHEEKYEVWNEKRTKIVEMLLQRPDINVNALSFEKFSPLDIAEAWIPEIPASIKHALIEKGAALNVFRQTQLLSTTDFHLDIRIRLNLQRFFYDAASFDKGKDNKDLDFLEGRLLTLIERFQEQIVSLRDQKGRTALHLTAISFSIISVDNRKAGQLATAAVKKLLSLGCSVNALDNYGRTPLHYADDALNTLLKSEEADASIKDKDEVAAVDNTSLSTDERTSPDGSDEIARALDNMTKETHLLLQAENKTMELNARYSSDSWGKLKTLLDPKVLWEGGKYAFRHPLAKQITKEVTGLMDAIAKEIGRLDPRFEIRPELVGSSNEGTRLGEPDEFDFCFVLAKISELCEVSQSPELPTGFVRLKRKQRRVDETGNFDGFFTKDAILHTEKLIWQFSAMLSNALVNIESQQNFDWNLAMKKSRTCRVILDNMISSLFQPLRKVSNINMIKPLNNTSVTAISIDIVPCFHVDGWWPDEAISNVSHDLKKFGCILIFDNPQKLYPWVPYSESCARISFAKAESETIKQSCVNAKEAYMIGKMMLEKSQSHSKYPLKNCLLYCIEALAPTSEKASQMGLSLEELKFKFHQMDRYLWLKCLMKCYLEFVSQDFCPCYFLPTSIGGRYLKTSSLSWMNGNSDHFAMACKKTYAFYICTSTDVSESSEESCCQVPAPDPLWERFDRNQLITSLCEIAYK